MNYFIFNKTSVYYYNQQCTSVKHQWRCQALAYRNDMLFNSILKMRYE